jgi:hypothetical protein
VELSRARLGTVLFEQPGPHDWIASCLAQSVRRPLRRQLELLWSPMKPVGTAGSAFRPISPVTFARFGGVFDRRLMGVAAAHWPADEAWLQFLRLL